MLAVIPARGGSKGVPNKNIRELRGKPLLGYTIEAALESGIFEKVIVSTDSVQIAEAAVCFGAEVPFMRPDDISGDFASSDAAVMHAMDFYRNKDIEFREVCKLQPTSPLRDALHLREAYQLMMEKNADFVVSVCECEHSPCWTGVLEKDLSLDAFMREDVRKSCRQILPTYYRLNGAVYMAKSDAFYKEKSFFGKNGYAYVMNQRDSIDIDNELDFMIAECIMAERTGRIL